MVVELFGKEFSFFADEDFRWKPYIWKMSGKHTGERAKYFGHSYAVAFYWLWFKFEIVWLA